MPVGLPYLQSGSENSNAGLADGWHFSLMFRPQSELSLAEIRLNELLSVVPLYKALGGGWS